MEVAGRDRVAEAQRAMDEMGRDHAAAAAAAAEERLKMSCALDAALRAVREKTEEVDVLTKEVEHVKGLLIEMDTKLKDSTPKGEAERRERELQALKEGAAALRRQLAEGEAERGELAARQGEVEKRAEGAVEERRGVEKKLQEALKSKADLVLRC